MGAGVSWKGGCWGKISLTQLILPASKRPDLPEGRLHGRAVDPSPDLRPAGRRHHDEALRPGARLLVPGHCIQQDADGQGRPQPHRKRVARQDSPGPGRILRIQEPQFPRKAGRRAQADCDRLAMQVGAVSGGVLDRVGKGVPEIEERPAPLRGELPLVRLDNARLAAQQRRITEARLALEGVSGAASSSDKSAASPRNPYLITSAIPAANSRGGRVARKPVETNTPLGWWKAPARFFPARRLTPVFPPTELSTMARSVVGT